MLTINPQPCWHLVHPDGKAWAEDGGIQHFDTADEAAQHVRDNLTYTDGPVADLAPRQYGEACWLLDCDGQRNVAGETRRCGAKPDDDMWGTVHFPTEAEALSLADVYDFTVDDDRKAFCERCQDEREWAAEQATEAEDVPA